VTRKEWKNDILVSALLEPPINAFLQITGIRINLHGKVCPDFNYVRWVSHISIGKWYEVNMTIPS